MLDAELTEAGALNWLLLSFYTVNLTIYNILHSIQHKQRCIAIEEQLVWLIMSAMERSEEDTTALTEDTFSTIHWLWVHISSQLIYFVLFQFASFPNIVQTLHDKVGVGSFHVFLFT